MKRIVLFSAILMLAGAGHGGELLIRNASVVTLDVAGRIDGADVRVRDGIIVEVGQQLTAAADAEQVAANGRILTPGLFAGLSAMGVEEIELEPSTVDSALTPGAGAEQAVTTLPRPEFDVSRAFNPDSAVIGVNRVEGFSFALIAPSAREGGSIFAGLGSLARLDGRFNAFLPASRSLLVDFGSDAAALAGNSRAAQYMLFDQAVAEARGDKSLRDSDYQLLTAAGRSTLAQFLRGGRVLFNVDRAADIRQVLALSRQHGLRPVISGGAEAWRVADELAAAKVPVIIDPLRNLPDSFDQLGARADNALRLQRAGVTLVFTRTGDATHNARKVRQAAGNAVAQGLDWNAALVALSRAPAEVFGVGDRFGRIAPGYQADLVLWSGDPLEVTSVAEQMWIEGKPQSMQSRQSLLRDRYLPAAR